MHSELKTLPATQRDERDYCRSDKLSPNWLSSTTALVGSLAIDGTIDSFHEGEERSRVGYYAEFDSLRQYAEAHDLPFQEMNGQASVD